MDATAERSVTAAAERAEAAFGLVGILLNSAAIRGQMPFLDMSLAEWRKVTGVILDGALLVSRAA